MSEEDNIRIPDEARFDTLLGLPPPRARVRRGGGRGRGRGREFNNYEMASQLPTISSIPEYDDELQRALAASMDVDVEMERALMESQMEYVLAQSAKIAELEDELREINEMETEDVYMTQMNECLRQAFRATRMQCEKMAKLEKSNVWWNRIVAIIAEFERNGVVSKVDAGEKEGMLGELKKIRVPKEEVSHLSYIL